MEDRYEDGLQVLLNVYDVTSTPGDPKSTTVRLNRITRELGLGGVFHGAIQIGATAQLGSPEPVEFSFGWCERGTGVYAVHGEQDQQQMGSMQLHACCTRLLLLLPSVLHAQWHGLVGHTHSLSNCATVCWGCWSAFPGLKCTCRHRTAGLGELDVLFPATMALLLCCAYEHHHAHVTSSAVLQRARTPCTSSVRPSA